MHLIDNMTGAYFFGRPCIMKSNFGCCSECSAGGVGWLCGRIQRLSETRRRRPVTVPASRRSISRENSVRVEKQPARSSSQFRQRSSLKDCRWPLATYRLPSCFILHRYDAVNILKMWSLWFHSCFTKFPSNLHNSSCFGSLCRHGESDNDDAK